MIRVEFLIAAAVLALLPVGCRSSRLNQELLEHELRNKEDYIYGLEADVDDLKAQVDTYRRENEALKRQATSNPGGGSAGGLPSSRRNSGIDTTLPPSVEFPKEQAPPFNGPPTISPPDPTRPEGVLPQPKTNAPPPRFQPNTEAAPPTIELPGQGAKPGGSGSAAINGSSLDVTQITLNHQLTGGFDADSHTGDEGVIVVVEPRNTSGEMVNAAGQVSIVLMDPSKNGDAGRVARWNFTTAEAVKHFNQSPDGGMVFECRWPNHAPAHRSLKLFVRYTTADGRKLDADQPIEVTLANNSSGHKVSGEPARQWTRSARPVAMPITPSEPVEDASGPMLVAPRPFTPPGAAIEIPDESSGSVESRDYRLQSYTEELRRREPTRTGARWAPYR
jgi:hypothetical protein